jgi:hypothetical protein
MKEIDEIEDLFASSFGNFEETPPEVVKSKMDAKLFQGSAVNSSKKWKWLLLLIPIIGLSTTLFYNFQVTKEKKTAINHNQINDKKEKNKSSENTISTSKTAMLINSKSKKITLTNTENSTIEKAEMKSNKSENKQLITFKNTNKLLSSTKNSESLNQQLKQANTNKTKNNESLAASNTTQKKTIKRKQSKENSRLKNKSLLVNNSANINSNKTITVDAENETKSVNPTATSDKLLIQNSTDKKEGTSEFTYPKTEIVPSKDSLENVNENSTQKLDSSKTNNTDKKIVIEEVKPTNNKENETSWSISFYGGIANGLNILKPTYTLFNEKIGTSFSLEANYVFTKKMGVSTGLGIDLRSENYSKEIISFDSVVSNFTIIYVTDSMNIIIDSIVTYFYVNDTTLTNENQNISYTAFSIPLYFNYTFFKKNNWCGAIGAGIRLNYFKTIVNSTNSNLAVPTLSNFGLQFQLRPQISYNWAKLSIGIYGQFGYDAKQATTWANFTRKRFNYGTGLVIRYRF